MIEYKEGDDPFEDLFERRKRQKKERIDKNKSQAARNRLAARKNKGRQRTNERRGCRVTVV